MLRLHVLFIMTVAATAFYMLWINFNTVMTFSGLFVRIIIKTLCKLEMCTLTFFESRPARVHTPREFLRHESSFFQRVSTLRGFILLEISFFSRAPSPRELLLSESFSSQSVPTPQKFVLLESSYATRDRTAQEFLLPKNSLSYRDTTP